ncbi:MAG: hypothetical protein A2Y62_01595 [Candidatus Fischerbacteria bacterium RBG_13_37_8]|uniref:Uncharacterized protein n=1 Tax=Candidatus Fischerbacteria bacterium RBG_13_37_8 TaxID=1817863 RepID=A0A1F5VTS7_9BACT|nr:MAG: hypothetical protein A2Y62_01595 [Candidatus Fischerbacteria bacterium RBG_13_37_8]
MNQHPLLSPLFHHSTIPLTQLCRLATLCSLISKPGTYVYNYNYDTPSQEKFEANGFAKSSENDKDFYDSSGYDIYTDKVIHELNTMSPSHFSISLDILDQFIASLSIDE